MYARSSLLVPLAWSSLLVSRTAAQCLSYGIDFSNGGSYFINTGLGVDFTSVTQFDGCQNDTADVGLYNLDTGDQWDCSSIPLLPNLTPETSTCNLLKSDMISGNYALVLLSNNGDGDPLANERDFYLDCGAQTTVTVTPTLTFSQTVTPTITSYTTTVLTNTSTVSNTQTVTLPKATKYFTVTPKPVTSTTSVVLTRTLKTWTRTAVITTVTTTATCTVPPRPQQPDPTCRIFPKNMQIPYGVNIPGKRDTPVSFKAAAKRMQDMRARRAANIDQRDLVKRSADAPTVTITETTFTANFTVTATAAALTVPAVVVQTTVVTTTLPPKTIYSGYANATITAPTPTKTIPVVTTTYAWQTKTMTAYFTRVVTVTPTASLSVCKSRGGHFGRGW